MNKISFSGIVLYFISILTKDIAHQNLDKIYGNSLSSVEKRILLKKYYSRLAKTITSLFLIMMFKQRFFSSFNRKYNNFDKLVFCLKQKKPVILLTGHFFNWECLPVISNDFKENEEYYACNKKIFCIRKKLRFDFINTIVNNVSKHMNMHIIPRDQALQKSFRELKKGNILIFAFDLNPKNYTRHKILTNFLGYQTESYATLAWLVKKTNAAVLPMYYFQSNKKMHELEFLPALEWINSANEDEEIKLNTQLYNDVLGEMIKKCPENWLWSVKRWN
jgi:KDO2-lipid IV(A) lauroyltransferase